MIGLSRAILQSAAWLVPREERAEWLAEWQSELCYLRRCKARSLRFCLGAVPDALWMSRNTPRSHARRMLRLDSPLHCLLFLSVMAAASAMLAFHLPVARGEFVPLPYTDSQDLVMIAAPGHVDERFPTVSAQNYREIASQMRAAFYRVGTAQVSSGLQTAKVSVAWTTANLFELLGIPIPAPAPALVLSDAAWRKHFQSDPHIVGRLVAVAGRKVPVTAVIPDEAWRLPGRVDAWLMEDDASLAAVPPDKLGFVLGRSAQLHRSWRWNLFVPNREGLRSRFECSPLSHRPPIWANFLFLGIALLILPVVTNLDRGDYSHGTASAWRWVFLAAKAALVLPIAFFASLDLASFIAVGLQAHCLLIGYVLAFRWVLVDQRQRCPECLRLLINPTRIGRPSQTFLAWWGTELMCGQGHGLLHVPELPSSSSSTPRWLTLEQSWSSLFS